MRRAAADQIGRGFFFRVAALARASGEFLLATRSASGAARGSRHSNPVSAPIRSPREEYHQWRLRRLPNFGILP